MFSLGATTTSAYHFLHAPELKYDASLLCYLCRLFGPSWFFLDVVDLLSLTTSEYTVPVRSENWKRLSFVCCQLTIIGFSSVSLGLVLSTRSAAASSPGGGGGGGPFSNPPRRPPPAGAPVPPPAPAAT